MPWNKVCEICEPLLDREMFILSTFLVNVKINGNIAPI